MSGNGGRRTGRPPSSRRLLTLVEPAAPVLGPLARRLLPPPLYARLRRRWRPDAPPPVGAVEFGSFRRLQPISQEYGFDRGLPVDRSYIEAFLQRHAADIQGRVLEISNNAYTLRFGAGRVARSDVLHVDPGHPGATFVGDLTHGEALPSGAFDCFILTQTLQYIYDLPAAVATVHRVLRPGGVVLATLPGITPTGGDDWPWYWSFTGHSARRCFEEAFPGSHVEVGAHGNVLTAVAFLEGLAAAELRPAELAAHDPRYPVVYTVRATKPTSG